MDDALAYLLELRLRCRGNPEAMAIVDRCLALLAQAERADGEELQRIEAEIDPAYRACRQVRPTWEHRAPLSR